MTQNLVDTRTYKYEDEQGKQRHLKVKYNITYRDGKIQNIFNEYNNSIIKTSETFLYFAEKYNK